MLLFCCLVLGECTFNLIFSIVQVHMGIFHRAFILKVLGSWRAQGERTRMDTDTGGLMDCSRGGEVAKGHGLVPLLGMVIKPMKWYVCLEN